jgi:hypothetical protein
MPDQWEFMSHTYDNCNCSVSCGCQFNEPTTHGNCQFAYVGTIVKGHFNDTPLTGLNWALRCKYPDEIAEGNGKRQIVIDERADEDSWAHYCVHHFDQDGLVRERSRLTAWLDA